VIVLNRPFLHYWEELHYVPEEDQPETHPKYLCINAAGRMCDILAEYTGYLAYFPCDIIYPVVLAAATMWQFSQDAYNTADGLTAHEQLDLCVRCLSIAGDSWKNAGRYRERLLSSESAPLIY
jgi:hypothetical protein